MITVFLFYNQANGAQRHFAFSKDMKHMDTITFDGSDYVLTRFDPEGIMTRVLHPPNMPRLIQGLKTIPELSAMVVCYINTLHQFKWVPITIFSCNELSRYIGSVDIGFCFNPIHMYNKLIKLDNKRNYEIIHLWRRMHGRTVERSTARSISQTTTADVE
jgi:hypothetical protein